MARFYIIHEGYDIEKTDDEDAAIDAAFTYIVIDTQTETYSDSKEADKEIPEYTVE